MSESVSLTIGGEVKTVGLAVGGKLFVFSPNQMNFLINLQKMKNVTAAALSVGKPEEWGQKFLKSRKFREYLGRKMDEFSVKSGLTVEWWYQFGKWLSEGVKEFYVGRCSACRLDFDLSMYEAESLRDDEMGMGGAECPACYAKPVVLEKKREEFKPTREQVEGWKAIGDRLIPKTERVHHVYENSQIIFESEGAS